MRKELNKKADFVSKEGILIGKAVEDRCLNPQTSPEAKGF